MNVAVEYSTMARAFPVEMQRAQGPEFALAYGGTMAKNRKKCVRSGVLTKHQNILKKSTR